MVYREKMLIRDLFPSDGKLVQYRSFPKRYKPNNCAKNRAALPNISILREKGTANLDTVLLPEFLFNGKQKYTFTVSEISRFLEV